MGLLGLCLKSRMIGKVTNAKIPQLGGWGMKESDPETKENLWVAHLSKSWPLGGSSLEKSIWLPALGMQGGLQLHPLLRVVPEQPSKGDQGPACAGKWSQPDGSGISQREPETVSRISWQKVEYLVAQILLSCLLSSYGWDLGKEGF